MELKELEELKSFNELDILYKIIDKAESIKKRVEKIVTGNKSAGVDVRKAMQDIRLMSEIIRDEVQRRKFTDEPIETSRLNKAIEDEKKRLAREEERTKKIEEKRVTQK